jgi:hypothetical protein
MSTPNGQKLQIMLEELAAAYGTTFDYTMMHAPPRSLRLPCDY